MKNCNPSGSASLKSGFTLIELIVVVFIISIIAAIAVPRFFSNPAAKSIARETEKISTLIHLARQEAFFEGRDYALGFSETAYSFYQPSEGATEQPWLPIGRTQDRMLGGRKLPGGHMINLIIEDLEIVLDEELPENPQIYILSSGETTPFEYALSYDDTKGKPVAFDALGRLIELDDDE